jgi:1-acyl-sn-glycerol-3-phosphate acyltransferase
MPEDKTASKKIVAKKRREYIQEEIEENKVIYDYFDPNFLRQLNDSVLSIISDAYFRPVYIGFDEMPERNNPDCPVILASNHSGMSFPWDAMIFGCGIQKQFDYDENKTFRSIVAPGLSGTPVMHPFYMKGAWKVAGGVDATYLNFETMMQYPKGNLLIYPEGVPGIGKGFNNKYKLQRFATSFIRMSLKYKTDVVPYSTVNAEYTIPYVYSSKWVNRQFNKIGVPFMSLGIPTLALIFPFAFYMAFPANMHFIKGTRISPYKWTDKPYEELSEEEINAIGDRVKASMQKDLDNAVEEYGQSPYKIKELVKVMWAKRSYFPYNLPIFWPFLFHEFDRQWIKERKFESKESIVIKTGWGAMLKLLFRNPITLFYFIPIIGWFFLIFYGNQKWKKLDLLGKPFD